VHAPQLVTQAEVVQAVWGEAYVSESLLRGYIRDLRAALGDEVQAPRFMPCRAGCGVGEGAGLQPAGRDPGSAIPV
jgi:DNA-binding response OmpR family regulator